MTVPDFFTPSCPKRHARTGRFTNDLREARGLSRGFFHRLVRARARRMDMVPARSHSFTVRRRYLTHRPL